MATKKKKVAAKAKRTKSTKAAKKVVKKAAKKATKRVTKKASKKVAKKAAKKATRKTSKKTIKKAAKKPAKSNLERVFAMTFASVYPHYVAKAEKKGRTKAEVDQIIHWLLGYTQKKLEAVLQKQIDIKTFITKAPRPNPLRNLVTGVVCGVRVEEVEDPTMRELRYLDKMIDELAKGKAMEKILRKP